MLEKAYIQKIKKKNKINIINKKNHAFGLICFVRHFRPTRNTNGQEKRKYELRVFHFAIHEKKTKY